MSKAICGWTCDNCREILKNPMKCAKCMSALYCNRECQKAHWEEHKKVCCIDIVMPSNEEMNKIAFELIEIIKSNDELFCKIGLKSIDNIGKRLTVLYAIRNRKINCLEQLEVSSMSVIEYQKATNTKESYDINDSSLHIIIKSERNHLMINGYIPLHFLI